MRERYGVAEWERGIPWELHVGARESPRERCGVGVREGAAGRVLVCAALVWERARTWRAGPFSILWGVCRALSSLEACDERRRICWRSSTSCVRPAALSHEQLACVQRATAYVL